MANCPGEWRFSLALEECSFYNNLEHLDSHVIHYNVKAVSPLSYLSCYYVIVDSVTIRKASVQIMPIVIELPVLV